MLDICKYIEGYNKEYMVYEDGKIFSCKSNKFLKQTKNSTGYYYIYLCFKGKTKMWFIHRLVAIHFIENLNNKPCVNHLDNNRLNNHFSNLEWCTQKENIHHAIINGYSNPKTMQGVFNSGSSKPIISIDKKTNQETFYPSAREAERKDGHLYRGISTALTGLRKTYHKKLWRYV